MNGDPKEIVRVAYRVIDRVQVEDRELQVKAIALALSTVATELGISSSDMLTLGDNIRKELSKNHYNKIFEGFRRYVREEILK